ncbi:MAG TPA: exodeoxyribonuclease V subunit gamma [Acidimicrobiales bacterium]|nr:exodeoxyribonuclease V subunit gamma [Acidimicrobiales bacterium]
MERRIDQASSSHRRGILATVLHLHRAERADGLVEALCQLVEKPLEDPMAAEVVSVPTRGVERWLAQRLSMRLGAATGRADGVCANVEFPFPGRLVGGAVAAASGIDRDTDPWLPERSVWPLLTVVDDCLGEAWMAPLAAHLGVSEPGADGAWKAHRFAALRRIADLYDRYGVHRPEMVGVWATGGDAPDADGQPLPLDVAWQAELWRRLRQRIGVPSPAERLAGACQRLESGDAGVELPSRLSLFGLTRLPASYVQVLRALAVGRDVHLFLLHPSPSLWETVSAELAGEPLVTWRRDRDPTARLAHHPLLASWGVDAREMQLVLTAGAGAGTTDDHHRFPDAAADTTLLARIQSDIRTDRIPPGLALPGDADARPPLAGGDGSIQIHSCHGQARQVEVLRDAILHLLAADPTLEVRDIIVMCPDIETFAPLIHATFGAGDADETDEITAGAVVAAGVNGVDGAAPRLRVRLADRSLRQTNPVLGVLAELLDLATERLTASQVLDLAGREPVRRRFGFDDEELARLDEWVADTGVRWGLDAAHRAPFKLDWLEANTWRAGLDRVLLGVAMAEEGARMVGPVLPLDDVGSGDIDLAGRFAEFVDRLHAAIGSFNQPKGLVAWAQDLTAAADALTATTDADSWQRLQLQALVDDAVGEATYSAALTDEPLTLPEIRALLADRLRGRPTRANFRTGHLTMCTLVPMRSVPHRVVCLLGLDDGVFPRQAGQDGDDIIGRRPHIGDRDARIEDRQLLLDALLAATEHLIITYAGRDERTNADRPPAVPVGELLDVVDRTVRLPDGEGPGEARRRVVVNHPLQPFDGRNFTAGALVADTVWSFDPVALGGARSLSRQRRDAPPFLARPLPPAGRPLVELDQLVRFAQHPVNAFLRQRLLITLGDRTDEVTDAVPIELDPLEQWGVGQRILDGRLAGIPAQTCVDAEKARGLLPPGALAEPVLARVGPIVEGLVEASRSVAGDAAEVGSSEVNVALPDGRLLVGTVAGVGDGLLRSVTYSRVAPKHRLAAWVRYLALTAAHPDQAIEAVTIGRRRADGPKAGQVTVARLAAHAGDPDARRRWAVAQLTGLVALYDRGMCAPLPIYCLTSAAYAAARRQGQSPEAAAEKARKAWESLYDFPKEDQELGHQLVLGGKRPLREVIAPPPGDDESEAEWPGDEPSRFGAYARRLWDGLLDVEEVVER